MFSSILTAHPIFKMLCKLAFEKQKACPKTAYASICEEDNLRIAPPMLESMMKNKDLKTEMTAIVMYCAAEMLRCYKETRETCTVDENMGCCVIPQARVAGLVYRVRCLRVFYPIQRIFDLSEKAY
jgi:hypothetical protein